jgi:cation diffusion facilitator CzcD-associated flavoprotein CzcO
MHEPVTPAIRGLEAFSGTHFHSARWQHECSLAGKKVAVIGSGASAIQFVPAIESQVAQLTLFQRTPPWILPKLDFSISAKWQDIFTRFPFVQTLLRRLLYGQFEFLNRSLKHPRLIRRLQAMGLKNMYRSIKDEKLRERLTPDYAIGCKRILQSNTRCDADVLIFATGFEVANPPIAERIVGARGVTLADQWRGSPEAYLGTTAEDCPNCFLTFGPNLYSFTSAFVIIEAQLNYILDGLKRIRADQIASVSVDPRKSTSYNKRLQASLKDTVWNSGGCVSYFIDKNGHNSTNWPWTTYYLRRRLGKFRSSDYIIENFGVSK